MTAAFPSFVDWLLRAFVRDTFLFIRYIRVTNRLTWPFGL